MRKHPDKIFWWVFGTHATAVFLLLVIPLIKGCFHPRPKEIVHFVEFVSEAPPSAQPVAEPQPVSKPQPVVEKPVVEPPKPTPIPVPEKPKPIPVPEKPKPAPVPEKPKPAPVPEKPKPAPVVRQTTRTTQTTTTSAAPVQKQITTSDIRKALGSAGTVDPFGAYYQTILARFYAVWQVPIGTAYGLSAQASITVGTDGTVSNRRLTRPSGNTAFDQSVQSALNAVNRLPAPPADLPSRTISIDFVPQ